MTKPEEKWITVIENANGVIKTCKEQPGAAQREFIDLMKKQASDPQEQAEKEHQIKMFLAGSKPTSGYDQLPLRSECPIWVEKMLDFLFKKVDIANNVEGEKVLYLRRYKIVDTMFGYVYLHNIQRPDEDKDPHDHPWSFLSILVHGGYDELLFDDDAVVRGPVVERRARGSVSVRGKDTIHRIVSVLPATWTLVICTPRYREWGFITQEGWVPWRKYFNYWKKSSD